MLPRIISAIGAAITPKEIEAAVRVTSTRKYQTVGIFRILDELTGVLVEFHPYKNIAFTRPGGQVYMNLVVHGSTRAIRMLGNFVPGAEGEDVIVSEIPPLAPKLKLTLRSNLTVPTEERYDWIRRTKADVLALNAFGDIDFGVSGAYYFGGRFFSLGYVTNAADFGGELYAMFMGPGSDFGAIVPAREIHSPTRVVSVVVDRFASAYVFSLGALAPVTIPLVPGATAPYVVSLTPNLVVPITFEGVQSPVGSLTATALSVSVTPGATNTVLAITPTYTVDGQPLYFPTQATLFALSSLIPEPPVVFTSNLTTGVLRRYATLSREPSTLWQGKVLSVVEVANDYTPYGGIGPYDFSVHYLKEYRLRMLALNQPVAEPTNAPPVRGHYSYRTGDFNNTTFVQQDARLLRQYIDDFEYAQGTVAEVPTYPVGGPYPDQVSTFYPPSGTFVPASSNLGGNFIINALGSCLVFAGAGQGLTSQTRVFFNGLQLSEAVAAVVRSAVVEATLYSDTTGSDIEESVGWYRGDGGIASLSGTVGALVFPLGSFVLEIFLLGTSITAAAKYRARLAITSEFNSRFVMFYWPRKGLVDGVFAGSYQASVSNQVMASRAAAFVLALDATPPDSDAITAARNTFSASFTTVVNNFASWEFVARIVGAGRHGCFWIV